MTHVRFGRRPFDKSFNNLVDDFFSELPVLYRNGSDTVFKGFAPVNIKETDKGYSLEVIAPGFDKSDFKVNVDQDVLTVSAEKKQEVKENAENSNTEKHVRREYSFRSFKRSFTLDEKIDAAGIDAKYNNGVLVLNLPKKEAVKATAQEINIQ
ncbi:MAG: Hsp20/alpha crystallin family protein [Chitinophagaceae bacterium]|jgi:HSP20 family protein|nr:MAG: Hsp20/alpha crystallin family protein [Chitinophagaceae bacterium]